MATSEKKPVEQPIQQVLQSPTVAAELIPVVMEPESEAAPAPEPVPEVVPEPEPEPAPATVAQVAPGSGNGCPACGNTATGYAGGKARCNQCGHTW